MSSSIFRGMINHSTISSDIKYTVNNKKTAHNTLINCDISAMDKTGAVVTWNLSGDGLKLKSETDAPKKTPDCFALLPPSLKKHQDIYGMCVNCVMYPAERDKFITFISKFSSFSKSLSHS